jgi:hypothetical protein
MKTENCREWQESLGAYALDHLPTEERAGLEAHLEGCSDCRAELDALAPVARLLPLADPERFAIAPTPPPELGKRIAAAIGAERRKDRRRRLRLGLALGTATAVATAALLAIFVLPGGGGSSGPEQHVVFGSLPPQMKIAATLEPHAFGTEIHVYVKGVRSGSLCRVFLRGPGGTRLSAGSFRYRWGNDSQAVLSSALDLSRTRAIGISVGNRTFIAPVGPTDSESTSPNQIEEDTT